jgi:hypothetical protein
MMIPAAGNSWKRFKVAVLLVTAGRHINNTKLLSLVGT